MKARTSAILLLTASAAADSIAKAQWAPIVCPADAKGTLPSPTYFDETPVFTTCSEQVIDAPIDQVYAAILNFELYHKWNTFVQNVTLINGTSLSNPPLDTEVLFTTYGLAPANFPTTSREIISHLQPPGVESGYAFAGWKFDDGIGGYAIRAEHPNILTEVQTASGGTGTRYVSWESYYGVGSNVVSLLLGGNLRKQFAVQGRDLKAYVEALSGKNFSMPVPS